MKHIDLFNRAQQLKAYGNAIVPQVAETIMYYIKQINEQSNKKKNR